MDKIPPVGKTAILSNGGKVSIYPLEHGYFFEFTNKEGEVRPLSLTDEAVGTIIQYFTMAPQVKKWVYEIQQELENQKDK